MEYTEENKLSNVLVKLLENAGLTETKLSRLINLPGATINRITNGVITDPKLSTLTKIADFFNVTVDQLTGRSPIAHNNVSNISVPLLNLPELQDIRGNYSKLNPTNHVNWINFENEERLKNLFALTVNGSAMAPYLDDGSIIIVDTSRTPKHRDFVVVHLGNNNILIRSLFIDGNTQILQSIEETLPNIIVSENDHILGVIIHVKKNFK